MELTELISEVKREGKISTDGLLMILADAVQKEDDPLEVYKDVYKKAYGTKLNESTCKTWVSNLPDGQKWTMEQTTEVGQRVGIDWSKMSKCEFWACMNAFHSDFMRTAKKYELQDEPEFFGDLVWDYFNDEDAHGKCPMTYYFTFVA